MIERYTRAEMGRIWDLENKFEIWKEIEVLACEAQAALGVIPAEAAAEIREKAAFDLTRIEEIERETNHDVIAFLTSMAEHIGEPSKFVHYGMTSSDLGDTALCYQMTQAQDIILEDVRRLGRICQRRALEFKDTLCVGRTHGIHAEPMTFGMKWGAWAWALKRAEGRLIATRKFSCAWGAISGAVGSYSNIDPFVEQYVCEKLGLTPDPLSTQVIARDRHAHVLAVLATVAATAESIATEIRALQKTDTLEAEEPFAKGQKGSSAMPHKRNPITAERVVGLARVVKANAQVGFDNVALWHERDISHSSAERVVLADSFIATDYLLSKLEWILDGLVVYPERMRANLDATRGLIYSSRVLLALVDSGMSREDAYEVVQRNSMRVWDDIQQARSGPGLRDLLAGDTEVSGAGITDEQLDAIFDPWAFLARVGVVFERVEGLEF
ncbi:MAG: adenylosuccinate lyase [Actinomycetota bacterium]|nr:MAG: adenylosuccinate [Actinomycetota bacterium]MDO8950614.1 adenylosuccinate lyase [Actinomycetota bacterium]MDP3629528.1 adenylosuccinate lyase [Actinomycetota bacterium]